MDKGAAFYQQYLDGDSTGMDGLIREYARALTFYLYSFVHDVDTAEDLMMDTFAKLCIKKPRLHGESSFKTWLFAIGRNNALDYLRKHKTVEMACEDINEIRDESLLEQTVLRSERDSLLHKCMKHLNQTYYQALWLGYFVGLSTKEIAHVLGKTTHATENILSRARSNLKAELMKEGFHYEDL